MSDSKPPEIIQNLYQILYNGRWILAKQTGTGNWFAFGKAEPLDENRITEKFLLSVKIAKVQP